MAYKPLYGRVAPNVKVPDDTEVETKQETRDTDMFGRTICPHGYAIQSACFRCADERGKNLPVVVAEKDVISPRLDSMLANPDVSLYEDVHPYSALTIGMRVVRRIRPEVAGRITMLEHIFTDSKAIKQLWVMFEGRNSATPYTPTELLRVRMQ